MVFRLFALWVYAYARSVAFRTRHAHVMAAVKIRSCLLSLPRSNGDTQGSFKKANTGFRARTAVGIRTHLRQEVGPKSIVHAWPDSTLLTS
jgi:hypothetical protein